MATRKSTRSFTPRQPATEGPDVVFNGDGWDIYHDGRYLGSRANNQDAWVEARRVHFDLLEQTAQETADLDAYATERISCDELIHEASIGAETISIYRPAAPIAPAIRIEPYLLDDRLDPRNGQQIGTMFVIDTDDGPVDVYFPTAPDTSTQNTPQAYAFGREGIDLDVAERSARAILALLADPRVQAARAAWQPQQQPIAA